MEYERELVTARIILCEDVKRKTGLDIFEYLIAAVIYNFSSAGDRATCYLSKKTLASLVGLSESQCYVKLRRLVQLRLVQKVQGKRYGATRYRTTKKFNDYYLEIKQYSVPDHNLTMDDIKVTIASGGKDYASNRLKKNKGKEQEIEKEAIAGRNSTHFNYFLESNKEDIIQRFTDASADLLSTPDVNYQHMNFIKSKIIKQINTASSSEKEFMAEQWLNLDELITQFDKILDTYNEEEINSQEETFKGYTFGREVFLLLRYGSQRYRMYL